jgi:adenylate kinase family enzyme
MTEDQLPPLAAFGRRVMICGPSCGGKSTFAVALGTKLGLPVVHLDQLRFKPGTDWQQRPNEEFIALHNDAIAGDDWIIEGNYRGLVPSRLERATGIVELLTGSVPARLWRYARRTLFEPDRPGNLEGNRDSIKWNMVSWITWREPARRPAHQAVLRESGLPMIEVNSLRELGALNTAWGLDAAGSRRSREPAT